MNKKIYILSVFAILAFSFMSCGGNDDDSTAEILAWKAHQDQIFRNVASSGTYSELVSRTGDGSVYYKVSTDITDNDTKSAPSTRLIEVPANERPLSTDSVVCRYMGWYLDADNKTVIFDGTETMTINGVKAEYNRQQGIGFMANQVIAGWTDLLTGIMSVGDEYEVCIPQQLA